MLKTRFTAEKGIVTCTAISCDLHLVAMGSGFVDVLNYHEPDTEVEICCANTGQSLCTVECEEEVSSLDFSSDGTMLVTGSTEGTIKLWGLGQGDNNAASFGLKSKLMKTLTL